MIDEKELISWLEEQEDEMNEAYKITGFPVAYGAESAFRLARLRVMSMSSDKLQD